MRAALAFAAALAVAGCGGGDGRKEAVEAAESWLQAVGDRDADAACELMGESATDAIRKKAGLNPKTTCLGVVRQYSDGFSRGDVDDILKIGLEAEGPVRDDEIGVFPRSGPRELQVILMRRKSGEWKVASTTLGPAEPKPTPTPAS